MALLGWNLPETVLGQLVQGLAAACALLALVIKERSVVPAIASVTAAGPVLAPETRPIAPSHNPA